MYSLSVTSTGGLIAGGAQHAEPLGWTRTTRASHDQNVGRAGDIYVEHVAEDEQLGPDVRRLGAAVYDM